MIALEDEQLNILKNILKKYFSSQEIRVFGSRYKHTNNKFSDIDVVIVGQEKIDISTFSKVKEELQESDLKYRVDLLDWNIISDEFKKVIEEGYEII